MASAGVGTAVNRRRVVSGLLVLALLVALVLAWRWWTHPNLFAGQGTAGMVSVARPVAKAALHVGITNPDLDRDEDVIVAFRGATAVFEKNTADAGATFWICQGGDSVLGSSHGSLESSTCRNPRPLKEGTEMTYSSDPKSDYVVVTVTPKRAGVARLDRVDLDYSLGADHFYRRGTESLDTDVTIPAR